MRYAEGDKDMSKPYEKKMVDIDKVVEDALEWWQGMLPFQQEDFIVGCYIKKFRIDVDDIDTGA